MEKRKEEKKNITDGYFVTNYKLNDRNGLLCWALARSNNTKLSWKTYKSLIIFQMNVIQFKWIQAIFFCFKKYLEFIGIIAQAYIKLMAVIYIYIYIAQP